MLDEDGRVCGVLNNMFHVCLGYFSVLSEPGFTGFVNFPDYEFTNIYSVVKDKGYLLQKNIGIQISYPVNPGSDKHYVGCFACSDLPVSSRASQARSDIKFKLVAIYVLILYNTHKF